MNVKNCLILLILAMLTAAAMQPAAADPLDDCAELIQTGKFDEARERIVKYRRKHPDDPRGLYFLAQLEENVDKALALYKEVELLALAKGDDADSLLIADALHESAAILFMAGKQSESAGLYERLITGFPDSPRYYDAVYRLAMINLAEGDPGKAIEKFKTCLDRSPNPENRLLAAAGKMECHMALEQWADALVSARETLDAENDDNAVTPRVLAVLSVAWEKLGNSENAAFYREQLLSSYPESYEAHQARELGERLALDGDRMADLAQSQGQPVTGNDSMPDDTSASAGTVPEQLAETTKSSRFSVQAGSFTDRMNAFRMYEKLKGRGLDSRVELKDVGGKHRYQVLVGRFASRQEAEPVQRKVNAVNDGGSFIVSIGSK